MTLPHGLVQHVLSALTKGGDDEKGAGGVELCENLQNLAHHRRAALARGRVVNGECHLALRARLLRKSPHGFAAPPREISVERDGHAARDAPQARPAQGHQTGERRREQPRKHLPPRRTALDAEALLADPDDDAEQEPREHKHGEGQGDADRQTRSLPGHIGQWPARAHSLICCAPTSSKPVAGTGHLTREVRVPATMGDLARRNDEAPAPTFATPCMCAQVCVCVHVYHA